MILSDSAHFLKFSTPLRSSATLWYMKSEVTNESTFCRSPLFNSSSMKPHAICFFSARHKIHGIILSIKSSCGTTLKDFFVNYVFVSFLPTRSSFLAYLTNSCHLCCEEEVTDYYLLSMTSYLVESFFPEVHVLVFVLDLVS